MVGKGGYLFSLLSKNFFLAIDDFFEIVEIIFFKNLAPEKQAMTQ